MNVIPLGSIPKRGPSKRNLEKRLSINSTPPTHCQGPQKKARRHTRFLKEILFALPSRQFQIFQAITLSLESTHFSVTVPSGIMISKLNSSITPSRFILPQTSRRIFWPFSGEGVVKSRCKTLLCAAILQVLHPGPLLKFYPSVSSFGRKNPSPD